MHGLFFDIGLGAGLAVACGLRPFLPLLLVGALARAHDLGVSFAGASYHFLQSGWWLLAVAGAMVLAYALQLTLRLSPTLGSRARAAGAAADPLAASLAGLGLGAGAVVFAGTLSAHGERVWPGLVGGILLAALGERVAGPVIAGARARLTERAVREALTLYLDLAALLAAVLVALLHPLGYVLIALFAWFAVRTRNRGDGKYAGLRILRR